MAYKNKLHHCKLGSAFDSTVRRLEISVVESLAPLIDLIAEVLLKADMEEKIGVMPPGSLEHQLLNLMDGGARKGKGGGKKGSKGGGRGSKG